MDEFAIENEVRNLHEIQTIDVAVNGMKEGVFTWGGLAVRPEKDNRSSDVALNRKKSADVIVPEGMFRGRYGEGRNSSTVLRIRTKW